MPGRGRAAGRAEASRFGAFLAAIVGVGAMAGEPEPAVDLRRACARVIAFRDCHGGGSIELLAVWDVEAERKVDLLFSRASDSQGFPASLFRWNGPLPGRRDACLSLAAPSGLQATDPMSPAGRLLGAGDIDGDRRADVAILIGTKSGGPKEIRVLRGGAGPAVRVLLPDVGIPYNPNAAFVGDLDGDGGDDLAIAFWAGQDAATDFGGVHLLLSRSLSRLCGPIRLDEIAGGGFGAHISCDGDGARMSFAGCGDLDRDGFGDIAVASSQWAAIVPGCPSWPAGRIDLPGPAGCDRDVPLILYDRHLLEPPRLLCSRQGDGTGLLIAFPSRAAQRGRSGAILAAPIDGVLDLPVPGFIEARERFTDGRTGWTIGEWLSSAGDFDGDGYEDILTASKDRDGRLEWVLLFGGEEFFARDPEDIGLRRSGALLLAGPPSKGLRIRVPPAARIDGDDLSDLVLPFEEGGQLGAFLVLGGSRGLRLGEGRNFRRGDSSADGTWDLADAILTLRYVFAGGPPPACLDAADTDDDGCLTIADPIALLAYIFAGGGLPPSPWACGPDCSDDRLGCDRYDPCEP